MSKPPRVWLSGAGALCGRIPVPLTRSSHEPYLVQRISGTLRWHSTWPRYLVHGRPAGPERSSSGGTAVEQWSPEASAELYRLRGWGEPYFDINARGHVEVVPTGE